MSEATNAKSMSAADSTVQPDRQIGGALGLAVLGTIAVAHTSGRAAQASAATLTSGYATALSVSAAIAGAWALPAWLGAHTTEAPAPRNQSRRPEVKNVGSAP